MDQHYNPLILARLRPYADSGDWAGLTTYLSSLSHSHFRTAGYILGERIAPTLAVAQAWSLMQHLVSWQPRAFVVTMAKAMSARLHSGEATTSDPGFLALCASLRGDAHTIDRDKLLVTWLPVLTTPAAIEAMLRELVPTNMRLRATHLLLTETTAAAFVLLRTLGYEEHDRPYLTGICHSLIRRGDSMAFKTASIIRTFYGLTDVRGQFALTVYPYELSGVDTDYEVFRRVVEK